MARLSSFAQLFGVIAEVAVTSHNHVSTTAGDLSPALDTLTLGAPLQISKVSSSS